MEKDLYNISNFNYDLPRNLIAQEPLKERHNSRLLLVNRKENSIKETVFKNITEFLNKGDVLVLNDTRVIRAKLTAKIKTGGKLEILLLKEKEKGIWEVLVNPGKKARLGEEISFGKEGFYAKIIDKTAQGGRVLEFFPKDFMLHLDELGKPPLPHYIKKEIDDFEKYQTIYSKKEGAVAAPTAGLHFTKELISQIEEKGIKIVYMTLHCGLATFRPVKCEDIREHKMDSEAIEISKQTADTINEAKDKGSRVIAVGTTSVRSLESASFSDAGKFRVKDKTFETNFYITPGYKFKIVDALITNFHTPLSTNLILVSSFCGITLAQNAYAYAKNKNFRFFSFGDSMFII
ncbi:MAG: tRNA preQ1(34) S-adenosylmethionine ribosyltransferase-isomerase QueA [Candidatus Omnitrophica bacterium]|nr:tRNA preQ1(34) S-adenosylmethionine ribosyltransferase-isomerase QueA [Candidatus Omnitrophota bacterium]